MIEGANAKVQKGGKDGLTFKTNGDYSKFTSIKIDNNNVAVSLYDSKSGSTIVTLKSKLIDKLAVGKHTIEFLYTDGSCGTEFEVQAATEPTKTPTPAPTKTPSNGSGKTAANTGDPNSMGTWMALAAISVLGIGAAMFARRRYGKY